MPFINSVRGSFSALRQVGGASAKNLAGITGGTITTPGDGYRYHTFTTSGTFDATSVGAPFLVDYLVVAGGGGGGGEQSDQCNGGGGGGGGVLQASGASFAASSFGVTIGDAGRYQTKPSAQIGENGGNSSLGPITAIGGGGGGVDVNNGPVGGGPTVFEVIMEVNLVDRAVAPVIMAQLHKLKEMVLLHKDFQEEVAHLPAVRLSQLVVVEAQEVLVNQDSMVIMAQAALL